MKQSSKKNLKQAKTVTKVTNRTEYPQIAAPVAYSQKQEFPNRSKMRSRRIVNSEFVGTIVGSTTFSSAQKFVINPGLVATFPWLSVLASEWQQYRIHRMSFRYVTRTSTSSVGSVILSPDYNAVDSPPTSEQIASNTQDAVEDVCWKSITCNLDVAAMFPFGPRKQIRVGNISGDYTTYDAGRLFVCVTGQASAADIGKLWVDYDVELFVPQSSPSQTIKGSSSLFYRSTSQVYTTTTPSDYFVDSTYVDGLAIPVSSGVFTPPAGNYLLDPIICYSVSVATAVTCTVVLYKNGAPSITLPGISTSSAVLSGIITGECFISANGTDTYSLRLTFTNASGILSVLSSSTVLWTLA